MDADLVLRETIVGRGVLVVSLVLGHEIRRP